MSPTVNYEDLLRKIDKLAVSSEEMNDFLEFCRWCTEEELEIWVI